MFTSTVIVFTGRFYYVYSFSKFGQTDALSSINFEARIIEDNDLHGSFIDVIANRKFNYEKMGFEVLKCQGSFPIWF